ncbi:MAG: hypothetical protein IJS15_06980 [Victivallales bacterium]|nr:hypothetical protein [Victivallales bacterium]
MMDIAKFSVVHNDTGKGLVNYLQKYAMSDEQEGAMRTYLVRLQNTLEFVGYFSLKAGLVSLREAQIDGETVFDTLPGVELANFAIDSHFIRKYQAKGIGGIIFVNFILPIIREVSKIVGVYLVYLFALPESDLIKTYERYGFHRLTPDAEMKLHRRLKPQYDESCIFMFYPLHT